MNGKYDHSLQHLVRAFVGLDLSLANTGFVVLDESGSVLEYGSIKSKPMKDMTADEGTMHRAIQISTEVAEQLASVCTSLPILVGIEKTIQSPNAETTLALAGLAMLVRKSLFERLAQVQHPLIIYPSSVKKFATGSGKDSKSQVGVCVLQKWGHAFGDDNIVDAFILAEMTRLWWLIQQAPDHSVPKYHTQGQYTKAETMYVSKLKIGG